MKRIFVIFSFCLIVAGLIAGCGRSGDQPKEIVATVNREAIYAQDLERELALKAKNDPLFRITSRAVEDHLQTMIDKRLLIQEAKRKKLDEKDKFIQTIKFFWEQTLIRDLVQFKEKESGAGDKVTEQEARAYYDKLSHQSVFRVLKNKDRKTLEKLLAVPASDVPWDEEIGPVAYDELSSDSLRQSFGLSQGERGIFEDRGIYYLVYVQDKVKVVTAPYTDVAEKVKEKINGEKKQNAFRKWFEGFKAGSDIFVNQKSLKKVQYRYG